MAIGLRRERLAADLARKQRMGRDIWSAQPRVAGVHLGVRFSPDKPRDQRRYADRHAINRIGRDRVPPTQLEAGLNDSVRGAPRRKRLMRELGDEPAPPE